MKQAVMTAPGKIEIRETERPKLRADEVLIEIKRIGVCGSDIHVWHGTHPYTGYPIVQGHEVAGIVAETGKDARGFATSEQVVFMPQVTCGKCYPCRHQQEHICDNLKVMGFQVNGAAQEFFAVVASKVLKVPDKITLDQAAMIEPAAVAVHALSRYGEVSGKKILVLGAGTIGNLTAQYAKALGAKQVLITDISEYKLKMARACGIEKAMNPHKADPGEGILEAFGADKADAIFECVGAEETMGQAIENARKGSVIIGVGVFGKKPCVDLGLMQDRELTLRGTLMYQRKDYERAIELIGRGAIQLERMITQRFPFEEYAEAYRTIDRLKREYLKVMIDL